jgi:lipopolysaccharide transport system permease protein
MTKYVVPVGEWLCWARLGWFDILSRYRRTVLGPLWIVLMTAMTVIAIGLVYSAIFRMPHAELLPFVAIGIVVWSWISTSLIEACTAFPAYKFIMTNHIVNPSSVIVRVVTRNLIILGHNFLVIAALLLYFEISPSSITLWLIPALMLLVLFVYSASILLAYACSRFRDMTQMVVSLFGLLFLITPIIWSPALLLDRAYIAAFNPFAHLLDLIRQPLLGHAPSVENWQVSAIMLTVCVICASYANLRWRRKVLFWL